MTELSDKHKELIEFFGTPKDGNTGLHIATNGNIRRKDDSDTGYFLGGVFGHMLKNPQGETIAFLSGAIIPKFDVKGEITDYFVNGFMDNIIYEPPKKNIQ